MKCRQGDNMGRKNPGYGRNGGAGGCFLRPLKTLLFTTVNDGLERPRSPIRGVFSCVYCIETNPPPSGGDMRSKRPNHGLEEIVWGNVLWRKKGPIPLGSDDWPPFSWVIQVSLVPGGAYSGPMSWFIDDYPPPTTARLPRRRGRDRAHLPNGWSLPGGRACSGANYTFPASQVFPKETNNVRPVATCFFPPVPVQFDGGTERDLFAGLGLGVQSDVSNRPARFLPLPPSLNMQWTRLD